MSTAPAPAQAGASPPAGAARYLHPGQLFATLRPELLSTVLGSCVAVCLWDARSGAGGMNHFLLPEHPGGSAPGSRYGSLAIPELIDGVVRAGARREGMVAKVFGGARVLRGFADGEQHLGARNVAIALASLEKERIPVNAQDVLGTRGRRLIFDTASGRSWVRLI